MTDAIKGVIKIPNPNYWEGSNEPKFIALPTIKGDKGDIGPEGPQGPQGPPGTDANVTKINVEAALGHTVNSDVPINAKFTDTKIQVSTDKPTDGSFWFKIID